MYFVAAVLMVPAGLFYAADNHDIGNWGAGMCRYGGTYHPIYVLTAAIVAAVWGRFVGVH